MTLVLSFYLNPQIRIYSSNSQRIYNVQNLLKIILLAIKVHLKRQCKHRRFLTLSDSKT